MTSYTAMTDQRFYILFSSTKRASYSWLANKVDVDKSCCFFPKITRFHYELLQQHYLQSIYSSDDSTYNTTIIHYLPGQGQGDIFVLMVVVIQMYPREVRVAFLGSHMAKAIANPIGHVHQRRIHRHVGSSSGLLIDYCAVAFVFDALKELAPPR